MTFSGHDSSGRPSDGRKHKHTPKVARTSCKSCSGRQQLLPDAHVTMLSHSLSHSDLDTTVESVAVKVQDTATDMQQNLAHCDRKSATSSGPTTFWTISTDLQMRWGTRGPVMPFMGAKVVDDFPGIFCDVTDNHWQSTTSLYSFAAWMDTQVEAETPRTPWMLVLVHVAIN
eukprot:5042548-Amphidinium_carterae.2